MQDRRESDYKNWDDVRDFISESRQYRTKDELIQEYQVKNIDALNEKVKIQNGRVVKLEEWKQVIEQKIKQRKDNYAIAQALITVVATMVMAVSALVMIWKK